MKKILSYILTCFLPLGAFAQLNADAGIDTIFCLGDSTVLGGPIVASGGLAPYTYTWSPTTTISNPTDSHPSVFPVMTTTYSLVVDDANGRSDTDYVVVTPLPPTLVLMPPGTDVCQKDKSFKLQIGIPLGGYYKGWGVLQDSSTFDPFTSGIGFHAITYFYYDTICLFTDSANGTMIVNQNPNLSISPILDTMCLGDSIMVITSGGNTYDWEPKKDLYFETGDSVWVSADSSRTYSVKAIGAGQCEDSSLFNIVVIDCETGVHDHGSVKSILVYPNPANESISIRLASDHTISELRIINMAGLLIQKKPIDQKILDVEIDLSKFETGQYIIRADDGSQSVNFIISR